METVTSLTCTKCQAKNRLTFKQLLGDEIVLCFSCGTKFNRIDVDNHVKQELEKMQNSIDSIRVKLELGMTLKVTSNSK